jgi:hypothetical protein
MRTPGKELNDAPVTRLGNPINMRVVLMNWYEPLLTGAVLDLLILTLSGAGGLLVWRWLSRLRRAQQRISTLERELAVYAEASTRVAASVEAILLARVKPGESVHSSRRYLLLQARERISQGDELRTTARNLGLSFDEQRLLEKTQLVSVPGRSAAPQHNRSAGAQQQVAPTDVALPTP